MNLNEQARIWLNEGDYQKVLDAIDQTEPLPPELSLLEAEARNMRGEAWLIRNGQRRKISEEGDVLVMENGEAVGI